MCSKGLASRNNPLNWWFRCVSALRTGLDLGREVVTQRYVMFAYLLDSIVNAVGDSFADAFDITGSLAASTT